MRAGELYTDKFGRDKEKNMKKFKLSGEWSVADRHVNGFNYDQANFTYHKVMLAQSDDYEEILKLKEEFENKAANGELQGSKEKSYNVRLYQFHDNEHKMLHDRCMIWDGEKEDYVEEKQEGSKLISLKKIAETCIDLWIGKRAYHPGLPLEYGELVKIDTKARVSIN